MIPRREVATWSAATPEEQLAIMALLTEVKDGLEAELHPDGGNVGIDVGAAGGLTAAPGRIRGRHRRRRPARP